jgi:hypothetical protein
MSRDELEVERLISRQFNQNYWQRWLCLSLPGVKNVRPGRRKLRTCEIFVYESPFSRDPRIPRGSHA